MTYYGSLKMAKAEDLDFTHCKKYTSQQKKRYKDLKKKNYAKTKTIIYYHLRQCLRETRLSSQNKQ